MPKGKTMALSDFLDDGEDDWTVEDDFAPITIERTTSGAGGYGDRGNSDSYQNRDSYRGGDSGQRSNRYEDRDRERRQPEIPVPDHAPFVAFVGNLNFSSTIDDIGIFFSENCQVKDVHLVKDMQTSRSKGFAYVTFEDRESLVIALEANGVNLNDRELRVNVAEGRDNGPVSRADTVDKWERGKSVPKPRDDRREDRRDDRREDRSFGRDDRRGREDRGFGRGGGDRRGGDRRGDDFERRERKPLVLGPNSDRPVVPVSNSPKSGSNPFGAATPRDELAFQKKKEEEREQRLQQRQKEREGRTEGKSDRSDKSEGRPKFSYGNKYGNAEGGRDFGSARKNMGQTKPKPKTYSPKPASTSQKDKKPKQAAAFKPQTTQKEVAKIPTKNIYAALDAQC